MALVNLSLFSGHSSYCDKEVDLTELCKLISTVSCCMCFLRENAENKF